MRPRARPDPALDAVEPAQAIRRLGGLALREQLVVGVQARPVVGMHAVVPHGRPVRALGQRPAEHALGAGARVRPDGAAVAQLARDDELGDAAEHALEALRELVALVRGLVQRRDVGDDAVDVDDPVGAQAVREDALPDPAQDAVVAAQPVLELERVQLALVGVAEDLVVARAIVGVDRSEPVVVVAARAVRGQPQQRARWRQRDERHETVVGVCLTAVDVQAERVDDGVQSPFGSTLRLTAPWGRFHGVPYRQEKACPEAFVRAIRTHTSCPRNRHRGRRRQARPRAPRRRTPRGASPGAARGRADRRRSALPATSARARPARSARSGPRPRTWSRSAYFPAGSATVRGGGSPAR